jgi:hypothetical protein
VVVICFQVDQELVRFKGRHTAHAGGCDSLTEDLVLDVAGCKDTPGIFVAVESGLVRI